MVWAIIGYVLLIGGCDGASLSPFIPDHLLYIYDSVIIYAHVRVLIYIRYISGGVVCVYECETE